MGAGASKPSSASATATTTTATPAPKASALKMDMTLAQLREYNGTDPSKPLLLALDGTIYDVSESRNFYGPDGPYAVFAGRECARALAFMRIEEESCTADVQGATEHQLKTLADWKSKFGGKYPVVGKVIA